MGDTLYYMATALQGTVVNGAAIVLGGICGILLGGKIPERVGAVILQGTALAVLLIGLQMALEVQRILVVVFSLILGGVTGELIGLDARLQQLGAWLEKRVSRGDSGVAKAFVFATLLYGVGAMAVTGALESGLRGSHQILYAKAVLDGVTAVAFAATMGVGISLSAVPVVLYQGGIALAAGSLRPYLRPEVIAEMSAVGGLLILCIGLGMLGLLKELKVVNFLPALAFVVVLTLLAS
ncbi:MAG: putative membrane protein YdfK [Syntrophomonadaceae bacterium]|nr:putative membrane protein YdfK [Bacillota bacterium]